MGKLVMKNIKLICPECETKFTLKTKPKREHFCENCYSVATGWTSIYECSGCGRVFRTEMSYDGESNRCSTCGRFAAIVVERACLNCDSDDELTLEYVTKCPECGDNVPVPRKLLQDIIEKKNN